MSEPVLVAITTVSLLALARLAISFARYRAVFRFDSEDLEDARRDAARRSRSTRGGRAAEQMAPLLGEFAAEFDPADARFLGAPVDYLVFDGLASGDLERIVLVEIKTGGGRLNSNERQVRDAIESGRVGYRLMRL